MESFSNLNQICIQVFNDVAKTISIFVLPLFMLRIVFSNMIGEGNKAFSILKGSIIYFILISAFPTILDILISVPETYLPKLASSNTTVITSSTYSISSVIPYSVDRVLEVILAGLYWLAYYLHIFFLIVMCSLAPIVFLSSTMMGIGIGFEYFIGLLIIGSSWPIIWYGFDLVHNLISLSETDSFGQKFLEILITLLKGIAPITFATLALKSPIGQSLTKAAKHGYVGITRTTNIVRSSVQVGNRIAQKIDMKRHYPFSKKQEPFSLGPLSNPKPLKESVFKNRLEKASQQITNKLKGKPYENSRPRNSKA